MAPEKELEYTPYLGLDYIQQKMTFDESKKYLPAWSFGDR